MRYFSVLFFVIFLLSQSNTYAAKVRVDKTMKTVAISTEAEPNGATKVAQFSKVTIVPAENQKELKESISKEDLLSRKELITSKVDSMNAQLNEIDAIIGLIDEADGKELQNDEDTVSSKEITI
jgi:hypothetical protein